VRADATGQKVSFGTGNQGTTLLSPEPLIVVQRNSTGVEGRHTYETPIAHLRISRLSKTSCSANQFRESPCALEIVYYLREMLTLRLCSLVVATCILYDVTLSPIGSAQQTPQRKKPAVAAPSTQAEHLTGDLDGRLKRRTIRVVVSYSKTQYYVLKGVQYGISYEGGRAFEKYIN
jgi:hypothetical protein